jgi:hypothetical protein
MDTLFRMNSVANLLIFVLGIVLMGFIPYLLGYRLFGRTADGNTKEVATHLFRAVGMLLGLMLSINFANVRTAYVKIQDSVELEAKEIGELASDFKRFGSGDAAKLREKLLEYLKVVIDDEWPRLAEGSLSQKAQELFLEIEDGILSLQPDSQYQQDLKDRLMKDIDEISDNRAARIYAGNVSLSWFVVVIMIGFSISSFLLCVNPVRPSTLLLISCYSAFIGIVLYSIVALNHPYHGFTHVSVKPFQTIHNTLSSQPGQSLSD